MVNLKTFIAESEINKIAPIDVSRLEAQLASIEVELDQVEG